MNQKQTLTTIVWAINVLLVALIVLTLHDRMIKPIGVEKDLVAFCEHDLINDTAECLTGYVKSIYQYNERVDSQKVTMQELIEEGGDCGTYSQFYKEAGKLLGKDAKTVKFPADGDTNHMVTILSDETGYCLFDQRYSACALYGGDEDDERDG